MKPFDLSRIPPAPPIVSRLFAMAQKPGVTVDQLADIIRLDPGLSARVVATCNSVVFSRGEAPETVKEAAIRLGFREVVRIAMTLSVENCFRPTSAHEGQSRCMFWERAVMTALAMEELSGGDDSAYLAGLMHLSGVWILARNVANGDAPVHARDLATQAALERIRHGVTYAQIGGMALRKWGFPVSVAEAVSWQLEPEFAEPRYQPLARKLNQAIAIADFSMGMPPRTELAMTESEMADVIAGIADRAAGIVEPDELAIRE